MCRLLGLIANKEVDIRFSMLEAKNSFKRQAEHNPHGWGIAWFDEKRVPHVEKFGEDAFKSDKFDTLIKEKKSKIFIAHVRYISSGSEKSQRNAHPFLFKNWVFAHNGTLNKSGLAVLLRKPYNQDLISEPIDSELYFRCIVQCIEDKGNVIDGIRFATERIKELGGEANFIMSDGTYLYAYKYGRPLYYLERTPDFIISGISDETKALIDVKKAQNEKAVIIATERITESEDWRSLEDDCLISITKDLKIKEV